MTTTSADRARQATTARMSVRAPGTQRPAGRSDRSAVLSQVQRATGNRGLTTLLAQRQVPLQRVGHGQQAAETDRTATTAPARDDTTAAAGNRAVQRLLPPSPVTVQRKGPSLSGLKKAIGLGKKKSSPAPAPAPAGNLRILPTAMGKAPVPSAATTAAGPGTSSSSTRGGAPAPYGQSDDAGSGVGGHIPGERANDAGSGSESEGPESSSGSSASDAYSRGLKFAAAAAMGSASSESSNSSSESSESDDPYARGARAFAAMQGPVGSDSSDSSSESSESDDPYARGARAFAAMQGPAGSDSSDSSSESSESDDPYARGARAFAGMQGPAGSDSSDSSSESSESDDPYAKAAAFMAGPGAPYGRYGRDVPEASGSASSESSESSSESEWDFSPPPRAFVGQQGTDSSDSASSSEDEPDKHSLVRERDRRYKDEFTQGSKDLPSILDQARSMVRDGRFASVGDFMKQQMGWSQADCDKYLTPGGPSPVVGKVRRSGRATFELHGGSSMTQGPAKVPFDTSDLYSKFMGKGYAIYVMDKRGRLYAAQHKVGIFHHSSFFAGGDVAGAGEIQVIGGVVKSITNKSGHYMPTEAEMVQVMRELEGRGVDLSAVEYVPVGLHFMGGINAKAPYPGGAKAFLRDHG